MSLPAVLATAVTACKARDQGSAFKVLSTAEAAEFSAIAAQIIPSGTLPGATEAGVIYFMDTVLADTHVDALKPMRQSLTELQAGVLSAYNKESFASLESPQQLAMLQGIENTEFFDTLRFLTLAGMFSNPSYGGNRDAVGWQLIGFEGPHPSQPPFGYYDADYAQRGE